MRKRVSLSSSLAIAATLVAWATGCSDPAVSVSDVYGRYELKSSLGVEQLDLAQDGTYRQAIPVGDGRYSERHGTWAMQKGTVWLEKAGLLGGESAPGTKDGELIDRMLRPRYSAGRLTLEFDPDRDIRFVKVGPSAGQSASGVARGQK